MGTLTLMQPEVREPVPQRRAIEEAEVYALLEKVQQLNDAALDAFWRGDRQMSASMFRAACALGLAANELRELLR